MATTKIFLQWKFPDIQYVPLAMQMLAKILKSYIAIIGLPALLNKLP